jgi:hypothetical protein
MGHRYENSAYLLRILEILKKPGAITGARVGGPAEFEYRIDSRVCMLRLDSRIRVYPTIWGACVGPQKLTVRS